MGSTARQSAAGTIKAVCSRGWTEHAIGGSRSKEHDRSERRRLREMGTPKMGTPQNGDPGPHIPSDMGTGGPHITRDVGPWGPQNSGDMGTLQ